MSSPGVTDARILRGARRLFLLEQALEILLLVLLIGAVAALGAVHEVVYRIVFIGIAALSVVMVAVCAQREHLARLTGTADLWWARRRGSVWLDAKEAGSDARRVSLGRLRAWELPLLAPGAAFAAWAALQLLPLPAGALALLAPARVPAAGSGYAAISVDPAATVRGLAFVACALAVHAAAAALFKDGYRRRRFARVWVTAGFVIGVLALLQMGLRLRRVYGIIAPQEAWWIRPVGPFINHNHFAGYMLLVIPLALARVGRRAAEFARTVRAWRVRHVVHALQQDAGVRLVLAALGATVAFAMFVAAVSRGAMLAFVIAFLVTCLVAGVGRRARGLAVSVAVLTAVTLGLIGVGRLEERFGRTATDAPVRVAVWVDTVSRLSGSWIAGTGLNTFEAGFTRVAAWALPEHATPWPDAFREAAASGARVGYRTPDLSEGVVWYREAHCDYIQVLAETGLVGLGLALWAAWRVLRRAAREPWVFLAVLAVLLHELVDFDLQIPALALAFSALVVLPPAAAGGDSYQLSSDS
jgi:hypothetical protein